MEITVGSEGFVTTHNKQDISCVAAWDFAFKESRCIIHKNKHYPIAMALINGEWVPAWKVEECEVKND